MHRSGTKIIENHLKKVESKHTNRNEWGRRHVAAWHSPRHDESISAMIRAWACYADAHFAQFGQPVGEDSVLGTCWRDIGHNLAHLLNGPIGRLDSGALDGLIRELLVTNGLSDRW